MRSPKLFVLAVLAVGGLILAGCTEQTEPATNITSTGATLRGALTVSGSKSYGEFWFEYSRDDGTTWAQTSHHSFGTPGSCDLSGSESNPAPIREAVSGLAPGSHYVFRMAATLCGSDVVYGDSNWASQSDKDPPYEYDSFDTPAAGIPQHVETWAYDDNWPQGKDAPASLVAKWVDYAEGFSRTQDGWGKSVKDCHSPGATCKALAYLDAYRNYYSCDCSIPLPTSPPPTEDWWLHEAGHSDAAHRLVVSYGADSAHGWLTNVRNQAVRDWVAGYARDNYDDYDGLLVDDSPGDLKGALFSEDPSGYDTSEELKTPEQVDSGNAQLAAAFTHRNGTPFLQVDNGINPNQYVKPGFQRLGNTATRGLMSEGNPVSDDDNFTNYYANLLDQMAYAGTQTSGFMLIASNGKNGTLQARRDHTATVLLGYSPGHVVSWADLTHDNPQLSIWPEQGIYPTQPVQSMPTPGGSGCLSGDGSNCTTGGHNALQVAPGVYRREFANCYNQGIAFGRCAVIVNWTDNPVTTQTGWLTGSYGHKITMAGGSVQSGGTVNLAGAGYAPATSIPAHDSVLLAP